MSGPPVGRRAGSVPIPARPGSVPIPARPGLADFAGREAVFARTELAGDGDGAVSLAHIRKFVGPEALEKHEDALARAPAHRRDRRRGRHPYALLVEQAIEQAFR